MAAAHDPYAALRFRDFRLFLVGRILGVIGWQMLQVALGWELYERTHSALALGMVGLVTAVPAILLALPAGHLADKMDRRKIVLCAQLLFVIMSIGLAIVSSVSGPIPLIFAILLVRGIGQAYNNPARSALLPRLVPAEVFGNAVTWSSSAFQTAAVVGPAIGGFVIALQHKATAAYVIDATLTAVYFVMLLMIRGDGAVQASASALKPKEKMTLESLVAGMRFVKDTKVVLAALTLDLFAVLLGGATALLPIFAKDILHVGPDGLGWLRAAPSIGALIVMVGIAHRPPMQKTGWTLISAVAGFGICTIVFGLSRSFLLSMSMLFLLGGLDGISMIVRGTLVQLWTPDEMRGRVSAVNSVFIDMSNELGGFESGALAAAVGPVGAVVAGGIGTVLVVAAVAGAWPELRNLGALIPPVEPETVPAVGD
ncbi:MAG TPA: MFS transporter [Gemmatimonadaceae bacterium]|nr:MFS transporter [Gemmatimonadaceae bacterium]